MRKLRQKTVLCPRTQSSTRLYQNLNMGSWLRSQNSFICLYIPSFNTYLMRTYYVLDFFWPRHAACEILTPTRDRTHAPCVGSADHQGSPILCSRLDSRPCSITVKGLCWLTQPHPTSQAQECPPLCLNQLWV